MQRRASFYTEKARCAFPGVLTPRVLVQATPMGRMGRMRPGAETGSPHSLHFALIFSVFLNRFPAANPSAVV